MSHESDKPWAFDNKDLRDMRVEAEENMALSATLHELAKDGPVLVRVEVLPGGLLGVTVQGKAERMGMGIDLHLDVRPRCARCGAVHESIRDSRTVDVRRRGEGPELTCFDCGPREPTG